jgi:hypothetical protein
MSLLRRMELPICEELLVLLVLLGGAPLASALLELELVASLSSFANA